MIIHHSLKILEQLTEIEGLIKKVENYMDEKGIEIDREKLLLKLLRNQEVLSTSRNSKD
ncbi:MAG: hypothetical protein ACLGHN_09970 [Bacteriovoracia bacterium]